MKMKQYQSSSGCRILVGQDDASNDYLTFKLSKPNDLWLHVNGAPGSHVLLKCESAADKQSIKEAAELAAWYSKLREGGKVSVHYCFARDVKKPRGAKPGSVAIRQFSKISVYPSLKNIIEIAEE